MTATVVPITRRREYELSGVDFSAAASSWVTAARAATGLTPGRFAAHLESITGWPVHDGVVQRWEAGACPPADVLLVCFAIAGHAPPAPPAAP